MRFTTQGKITLLFLLILSHMVAFVLGCATERADWTSAVDNLHDKGYRIFKEPTP